MSRGTRDYWPLVNLSIFSKAYTDTINAWFQFGTDLLDTDEDATLIDYTVPADTILIVGGGFFTCSRPFMNRIIIKKDATVLADFPIDVFTPLPTVPWGWYRLTAAEQLTVQAYNYLDQDGHRFTSSLVGFTEVVS